MMQHGNAYRVRRPNSRTLVYSTRGFLPEVSRCHLYEFQDVIAEIEQADLVAPGGTDTEIPKQVNRVAGRIGVSLKRTAKPRPFPIERDYEIFFASVQGVSDLEGLFAVPEWRSRCRLKICLMTDVWLHLLQHQSVIDALSQFDVVLSYCSQSVSTLQRQLLHTRVIHCPACVDLMRFTPLPHVPPRSIDVFSMGRRSQETHESLLAWSRETGAWYVRDVMHIAPVIDYFEYREHVSNLAKRSKLFLAYRGLVNRPEIDQHEVGLRYYEGVAAGCILLGEIPNNETYGQMFDWPEALVELPYGSVDGPRIVTEVLADTQRVARIRRDNVTHSLAKHDTSHRWRDVLKELGIPMREAHTQRLAKLQHDSNLVHQGEVHLPD